MNAIARQAEFDTLDAVIEAAEENARDEHLLARRVGRLRSGRASGHSWHDLLGEEPRPGALDLVARILHRLAGASGTLRRTVANGLRAEGAKVSAIADRFAVSHQRVSALLRQTPR